MSMPLRLLMMLALLASALGACGGPSDPCRSGQTVPTVTIIGPNDVTTETVVALGQVMNFSAVSNPVEVSYAWTLSGPGSLGDTTKHTTRYTAPDTVTRPEDVTIAVRITDQKTTCVAEQRVTLRLLPGASAAAPTKAATSQPEPTPTPKPALSPTPMPSATPATPPPLGLNLRDGDQVEQTITLMGDLPPNLKGDLWVFIVPPNGMLYPQSPNACKGAGTPKLGNRWELRVGFGGADDEGIPFTLVLADADAAASQAIADTLRQWCRANNFPGMQALPAGATELGPRVGVTRNAGRWGPAPAIPSTRLPGQVALTSVADGDQVTQRQLLKGTYTGDVVDTIWVLVHASNGRWYPQSANACTGIHAQMVGGTWQVLAGFGGPANAGEPFDVVVALANADAHAALAVQQKQWCEANNYAGYLTIELPAGLAEQARVRVVRK